MMTEIVSKSGTEKKIRILMADDHPLLRKALRDILVQQVDFEIVAEAGDGEEAVRKAAEVLPDVVIMDISMPVLNGLEATRQIKAKCPGIAVLVLTVHSDNEHILGILESGAAGYLTKSVFDNEVVAAIRAVVAGETVLAAPIFQQILKHALRYTSKTLVLDGKEKLSVREMEILKLAAKGISNKEIASTLNLSLRTVKGYMVDVFSKLHVSSRTEAVITGLRAGLLSLDDIE